MELEKRAWVLIVAPPDAADDLAEQISTIEGARRVDVVEGPFTLVAAIARPDQESLVMAIEEIRHLEGVKEVQVCYFSRGWRGPIPWP